MMKRFINYMEGLQKQNKVGKGYLYFAVFGILLTLAIALTLPNYFLNQNQSSTARPPAKASGNTLTATTCNQADVQAKIDAAVAGDTVIVPNGDCTWSSPVSFSGIMLQGQTAGSVIIRGAGVSMTKHSTQYTRLSNFRFLGSSQWQWLTINGSPSDKPFIVDNNYFQSIGQSIVFIWVNGGLLHHNTFEASPATGADIFQIATTEDWSQAPTFGTNDATGERNIYFEDNTWTNVLETAIDADMGSRIVVRHNTLTDSSFVLHSGSPNDSSPRGGNRQFEFYNNNFVRVSNSLPVNKWIWVRGGSGVIANNVFDRADSPDGFSYSPKVELLLTVGCPSAYPIQYQIGQTNVSPENPPTQPLAIWGNTGLGAQDSNFIAIGGNPVSTCSNASAYIQQGRDYILTAKPNYTSYTYPHPLTLGGTSDTPTPTSSMSPTPTSSIPPTSTPIPSPTPTISIPTITPFIDTTPPTVSITFPLNGSRLPSRGTAKINAVASDSSGIRSIQIWGDSSLLTTCNSVTSCSNSWNVNKLATGTHTITAKATDNAGNIGSISISVTK